MGGRSPKFCQGGRGVINLTIPSDFDQVTPYIVAGQTGAQDVGGINVTQIIYFLFVKCLFLLDIILLAACLFTCLLLVITVLSIYRQRKKSMLFENYIALERTTYHVESISRSKFIKTL